MEQTIKKGNVQDLRKFFGILSKEAGDELERNIKRMRSKNNYLYKNKIKRMKKMFDN